MSGISLPPLPSFGVSEAGSQEDGSAGEEEGEELANTEVCRMLWSSSEQIPITQIKYSDTMYDIFNNSRLGCICTYYAAIYSNEGSKTLPSCWPL